MALTNAPKSTIAEAPLSPHETMQGWEGQQFAQGNYAAAGALDFLDSIWTLMGQAQGAWKGYGTNTWTHESLKGPYPGLTAAAGLGLMVLPSGEAEGALEQAAASSASRELGEAFHYGFSRYAKSIEANGLRAGTYATPVGNLSPLQAQIELALPPNRGLPDMMVRIDVAGLRRAGYEIPSVTRVSNTVTGSDSRVYTMPGGGYEMQFPYRIPAEYVNVEKP